MIDLERRLRRTYSSMAANESLADGLDDDSAAMLLKWSEVIAKQFVLKTSAMEDDVAAEYLAPYSSALLKLMRAIGHCAIEKDQDTREEWWNRIEQNGKTLFGDSLMLPPVDVTLAQLPPNSDTQTVIGFIQKLIETQKAKG